MAGLLNSEFSSMLGKWLTFFVLVLPEGTENDVFCTDLFPAFVCCSLERNLCELTFQFLSCTAGAVFPAAPVGSGSLAQAVGSAQASSGIPGLLF